MSASVSMPLGGVQVGSYDSYEQAQAAVDYLSDEKFAVENVTIIGSDLRMVERVTGRLSWGRAITAGAAGGAWWGLFVGLLLGIFASDGTQWIGSVIGGLLIGLAFGAAFGAMGYAATRGRRDFTSTSQIVAGRYDVMCNPAHAEEARAMLARFSLRN
ncbi:general stress protein [Blastococcus sp. SYSU D00669]